ncbi:putative H(+)-transporting two-sector ATPase [Medicago truncatula]|uniref:Putative H(+)-transporting two-sector ATPase n=1 Tax=Medicago truncatula TaxID=3880 RepID=A0A396IQV4_MEDTR|nr:putative H(+)-transporting two-sector ATPase [Medicago truncatula]
MAASHRLITIIQHSLLRCSKPSIFAATMLSQSSSYNHFILNVYSTKSGSSYRKEIGHVCHVTNQIVDVSIAMGLPPVLTALEVLDRSTKLLELAEHLNKNFVRTVAMQAIK